MALVPSAAGAREPGASARALGVGDAVQAIGLGTAGLYFNPATLSQIQQYAIDAGYGYDHQRGVHNAHVSISDSQTNPEFAGGVGYTYFRSDRVAASFQGHDVRAALSAMFGSEAVSFGFGAGFRYLKVSGDLASDSVSAPTLDLGALLGVADKFWLGIAGQNLITFSSAHAPRTLGIGAGATVSIVNIGSGVVLDFETKDETLASPAGGIEVVVMNALAIRSGFTWDRGTGQKRMTGGLGYISQFVGVDLGYGHDVTNRDNWLLQSSIRVFLP
ncbi:MAG: hypothetical protein FJ087_03260 [Deltaproteobacteria bacterium]|nr:hypothetical protein [Deltaproteobacteria bacterium]